jgi:hypothetical protein
MTNFINLTPHNITIVVGDNETLTIEKSGDIARLSSKNIVVDTLEGIQLVKTTFGDTTGLPDKKHNTFFIVSALVRQANADRDDLVSPGDLVRDDGGNVVGCKNLICNF